MKKSKKGLVISIIVLSVVMLGSFIAGGISLSTGVVQALRDTDIPAMFEEMGISDGIRSLIRYAQYIEGGEEIRYESDYVSEAYKVSSEKFWDMNTLVIENIGYDIELKGMPRSDVLLSFKGKYPSTVETKDLFTCSDDSNTATITFSGIEMPGHFDASIGTVTIYIPSSFTGNIIICNCMGEAEFTNVHAESLTISYYAGEIVGSSICTENVTLYAVAGETNLKGDMGSYNIDNCAGQFEFTSNIEPTGDSSIKNTFGEVEIALPGGTEIYVINNDHFTAVNSELEESRSGAQFEVENVVGEINFEED